MCLRNLNPQSNQLGFTLIEILLVLVLLAISSVAVIATLPSSNDDLAKQQAQALYQRILLIGEEAILSGRDFGLYVDDTKGLYQFLKLTSDGWQELDSSTSQRMSAKVELPESLSLSLSIGGGAWQDEDRLFEPGSLFDEDMFAELEEQKKVNPPQLLLLSSGESTPFRLGIYPSSSKADETEWQLEMSETSVLTLFAPGDERE